MMWLHKVVMQNSYSPNGKSFYTSAAFKRVRMVIETYFAKRQINLGMHMLCVSFMWFLNKIFTENVLSAKDNNMEKDKFSKCNTQKPRPILYYFGNGTKKLIICSKPQSSISKNVKGIIKAKTTLNKYHRHEVTLKFTSGQKIISFLVWV